MRARGSVAAATTFGVRVFSGRPSKDRPRVLQRRHQRRNQLNSGSDPSGRGEVPFRHLSLLKCNSRAGEIIPRISLRHRGMGVSTRSRSAPGLDHFRVATVTRNGVESTGSTDGRDDEVLPGRLQRIDATSDPPWGATAAASDRLDWYSNFVKTCAHQWRRDRIEVRFIRSRGAPPRERSEGQGTARRRRWRPGRPAAYRGAFSAKASRILFMRRPMPTRRPAPRP